MALLCHEKRLSYLVDGQEEAFLATEYINYVKKITSQMADIGKLNVNQYTQVAHSA
jgi:hypothetical protein